MDPRCQQETDGAGANASRASGWARPKRARAGRKEVDRARWAIGLENGRLGRARESGEEGGDRLGRQHGGRRARPRVGRKQRKRESFLFILFSKFSKQIFN
jgi:hypothetical protein